MRALLVLALSVAVVAACGVNTWDPPNTKPSPDHPCGTFGVVCPTQHSCCVEGSTCGGEPDSVGCPAGQCCAIGTPVYGGAMADAGSPKSTPQRPFNR